MIAVTLAAALSVAAVGVAAQLDRSISGASGGSDPALSVPEGSVVVTAATSGATEPTALSDELVDTADGVEGVLSAGGTYEQPIAVRIEQGSQDDRPPMFRGLVFTSEWNPQRWRVVEGDAELLTLANDPEGSGERLNVALDAGGLLSAGARVGDDLRLQTPTGGIEVRVVAMVAPSSGSTGDGAPGIDDAHIVIDPAVLADLLGARGRVDRITVVPLPGVGVAELTSRLDAALPSGLRLSAATDAAVVEARAVSAVSTGIVAGTWAFALLTALVAALLVSNTFSIVVTQRSTELALARCLGATRAQAIGGVVAEAAIVGVLAAIGGLSLGIPLSMLGTSIVRSGGSVEALVTPGMVAAAVGVGQVITVLAATVPALRAGRVAPVEALRTATTRRRRRGPLLAALTPALWLVGRVVRRDRVASMAVAAPRQDPRRAAATVSTLLVGLGLVALVLTASTSVRSAIDDQFSTSSTADLFIRRRGVVRVDPAALEDRLGVPPGAAGFVDVSSVEGTLIGPDGTESVVSSSAADLMGSIVDLDVVEGAPRAQGDSATPGATISSASEFGARLSTTSADRLGVELGDVVTLRSVSGDEVELTLDAVYRNTAFVGPATVDRAAAESVGADGSFEIAAIDLPAGLPVERVGRRVDRALAGFNRLTVDTPEGLAATDTDIAETVTRLVLVLLSGSVLLGGLGTANHISLSVLERRRELALLRTIGAERRQIRQLVTAEAIVLCSIAGVMGALGGTTIAVVGIRVAPEEFAATPVVPWGSLIVMVAASIALGAAAAALPARTAARRDALADLDSL